MAVVIFDGRSEIDPFAGVRHWVQAIRQAEQTGTYGVRRIKMILVAARVDRGGIPASQERIQKLVAEFGFEAYFETSAKEGWGVGELLESIREGIDWNTLPKVTSTELFQRTIRQRSRALIDRRFGHDSRGVPDRLARRDRELIGPNDLVDGAYELFLYYCALPSARDRDGSLGYSCGVP